MRVIVSLIVIKFTAACGSIVSLLRSAEFQDSLLTRNNKAVSAIVTKLVSTEYDRTLVLKIINESTNGGRTDLRPLLVSLVPEEVDCAGMYTLIDMIAWYSALSTSNIDETVSKKLVKDWTSWDHRNFLNIEVLGTVRSLPTDYLKYEIQSIYLTRILRVTLNCLNRDKVCGLVHLRDWKSLLAALETSFLYHDMHVWLENNLSKLQDGIEVDWLALLSATTTYLADVYESAVKKALVIDDTFLMLTAWLFLMIFVNVVLFIFLCFILCASKMPCFKRRTSKRNYAPLM